MYIYIYIYVYMYIYVYTGSGKGRIPPKTRTIYFYLGSPQAPIFEL